MVKKAFSLAGAHNIPYYGSNSSTNGMTKMYLIENSYIHANVPPKDFHPMYVYRFRITNQQATQITKRAILYSKDVS